MEFRNLYGVLLELESAASLLDAVRCARQEGYEKLEAYTPYPIPGLPEALGRTSFPLARLGLVGGIVGAAAAYAVQFYTSVVDYPLNVGGRPLHSWPAFLLVTFELGILFAALAVVGGFLLLSRLPLVSHPLFRSPEFRRATQHRFFLCVRSDDAGEDLRWVRQAMERVQPLQVTEIPL